MSRAVSVSTGFGRSAKLHLHRLAAESPNTLVIEVFSDPSWLGASAWKRRPFDVFINLLPRVDAVAVGLGLAV